MNKTKFISVRTAEQHKKQLVEEAKQMNMTVSQFVLDRVIKFTNEKNKNVQTI